ncbi:hypothetical protein FRC10_010583 [Ceratobasidium sp. 414]|nr:hypothetical protein FRC10_010583 [Ceratobasidium sp. 414]
MYCLAYTYWRQEELQVHLVDASKRVLGSEHPRTLLAMNHLAATYQSLGGQRRKQYEELQAEIHRLEALSQ